MDEEPHFDLVHKYAALRPPTAARHSYDREVGEVIGLCGSPEYWTEVPSARLPPPIWRLPAPAAQAQAAAIASQIERQQNHEAFSPPVYYLLAAAWLRMGKLFGLETCHLLYWVRFLNVVLHGALVWLAYRFAKGFFPDRPVLRLAVPLLAAAFPQDVFYCVNNDALSPLAVGASLYLLLEWDRSDDVSPARGALAGAGAGLAFLTKYSNIGILPPLIAALARKLRSGRTHALEAGACVAGSALPVGLWLSYSAAAFGDVTGTAMKVEVLGWTPKPWNAVFDHPIFSAAGAWTFWSDLMKTFWRGELVWHVERLAWRPLDAFYALSSALLVGAAVAAWFRNGDRPAVERRAEAWAFACFAASAAFLAFVSVRFHFGASSYPSAAYPYVSSGRLIGGSLLPFLVLYVSGLARVFPKTVRGTATLSAAVLIAVVVTVVEIVLSADVFRSAYNWYHLD